MTTKITTAAAATTTMIIISAGFFVCLQLLIGNRVQNLKKKKKNLFIVPQKSTYMSKVGNEWDQRYYWTHQLKINGEFLWKIINLVICPKNTT